MTDNVIKGALFVYDYPKEIKSFYMKENDDGKTVQAGSSIPNNLSW